MNLINKIFILFILFSINELSAQSRISEIKYSFLINNKTSSVNVLCVLINDITHQKSTFINLGFEKIPENSITKTSEINGDSNINIQKYNDGNGQKPEYQKDFSKDSLYAHESVYGEKEYYIIVEKLPEFDWEIVNEYKEILDYKVQKAEISFRGRQYVAWFAPEIKIYDGPYKFHGLPGLILEIASVDKRYKFKAYSINLWQEQENFKIESLIGKYPNKKVISIHEKLKIIDKNTIKEKKYQKSKNPNIQEVKIKHNGIETDFTDLNE